MECTGASKTVNLTGTVTLGRVCICRHSVSVLSFGGILPQSPRRPPPAVGRPGCVQIQLVFLKKSSYIRPRCPYLEPLLFPGPGNGTLGLIQLHVCGPVYWSVFLFVLTSPQYACGGTATSEATFPRHPAHTRVTAEETRCRIATRRIW